MHDITHVLMDYAIPCASKHAYMAVADAYAYMAVKTRVKWWFPLGWGLKTVGLKQQHRGGTTSNFQRRGGAGQCLMVI